MLATAHTCFHHRTSERVPALPDASADDAQSVDGRRRCNTPDSEAARKFAWMVKEFLDDAPRYQLYRSELSQMLADWQTSGASLGPMIDRSPALKEIKPLAHNLSHLGETGLEAMSYLKLGMPPPREWRRRVWRRLMKLRNRMVRWSSS